MEFDSRIFVSGHKGLVGSSIVRALKKQGYSNIITVDRDKVDLSDPVNTQWFFSVYEPEYVFDAAARVGGIQANRTYPAEFIRDNLLIEMNLIHNSYKYNVKKFLFMGSVCIYPKFASVPVKEDSLLTGHLEPTNEAYSMAKIAGIKMCEAYHRQYGFNSICVMPSNVYGPNDNFDKNSSHVIPSMIKKFMSKDEELVFWGDGSSSREFLYVDDLADACIFLMNNDTLDAAELINIGSGEDIFIKKLSEKISKIINYNGTVKWDTSYPNGTPTRALDLSKMNKLGWKSKVSMDEGIRKTIDWYTKTGGNRNVDVDE
jgi:GDP-L-fucose synthase